MIYNQIKKRLYFIPVFIYTFIKLKSNKRGKVMPTEDKTYKSDAALEQDIEVVETI